MDNAEGHYTNMHYSNKSILEVTKGKNWVVKRAFGLPLTTAAAAAAAAIGLYVSGMAERKNTDKLLQTIT